MKSKEKFIRRKKYVRGKAVAFRIDTIKLPNGKKAEREYLDHPGAVAVVAEVSRNKLVLVKQYRHPVHQLTWELPAGKLDKNEAPSQCVKRELTEETGYRAGRIKKLVSFWPTPAFANEIIHIYFADKLKPGKQNPDEDEFLSAKIWPIQKILSAIKNGRIKDSKTIIGLLAYLQWRKNR